MSRKFLTHIDLAKNELQNVRIQNLASDPSSPVEGQIYQNTTTHKHRVFNGTSWDEYSPSAGGGGDASTNTSSSVDSEVVLFSGTSGKTLKRATISGLAKLTSGVLSSAVSGTDYAPATSGTAALKGNGSGGFSTATLNDVGAATGSYSLNNQKIINLLDPTLAQDGATKNYVDNKVDGLAWKQAVVAATTVNGTLASAFANASVVDGVTLVTGDRILVKNQTTGLENGIYTVNASGAPARTSDADTSAELVNATVFVQKGTVNADTSWTCTTDAPIIVGTTSLVFAQKDSGALPDATTSTKGKVQLATSTEAETKTDTAKVVTPSALVNFGVKKIFTIGDGSSTSIACTHNLGTKDVLTQVRQASDDSIVECDIVNTSTTVTTLIFAVAPAASAIKVVIIG